jgi:hypothetical protein
MIDFNPSWLSLITAPLGFLFLWLIWKETRKPKKEVVTAGASATGPITPQSQLRLGLMSESGEFGDGTTNGWPSNLGRVRHIQLSLFLNSDDGMDLERVRIEVAGEPHEATGWVTLTVGGFSGVNGASAYFPAEKVTGGIHDVRIEGYAEGQWWRSPKAYRIWFPSQ